MINAKCPLSHVALTLVLPRSCYSPLATICFYHAMHFCKQLGTVDSEMEKLMKTVSFSYIVYLLAGNNFKWPAWFIENMGSCGSVQSLAHSKAVV